LNFKSEPFPHQLTAFHKHKEQAFFALFMDMGTGKTKILIDVACSKYELGEIDQVLVFAPNNVHTQWAREQMPLHCALPYESHVWENSKNKAYVDQLSYFIFKERRFRWFFVNIEALSSGSALPFIAEYLYTSSKRTLVAVDEASRIKNHNTVRFQRLFALRRKYKVCTAILTGTPMAKAASDVWAMYEFLQPKYIGCSFTAFNRRHSITHMSRIGNGNQLIEQRVSEKDFWFFKRQMEAKKQEFLKYNAGIYEDCRPVYNELTYKYHISVEDLEAIDRSDKYIYSKNIERLKAQVEPCTTFIRKQDCLQLPEKIYEEHVFEAPLEYRRLLKQLKDYAVAAYGNKELTLMHKASLQLRARQICGGFFPSDLGEDDKGKMRYDTSPIAAENPKLAYIRGDIPELGDQQFIIWAVFPCEIKMIVEELKEYSLAAMHGETSVPDRNDIIQQFGKGELQGIVANPAVMGYGFNLQQASIQYWYSRDYRTEARLQAEDRSHRMGITRSPVYKDLVYNVASEKAVLTNIKQGADMNEYFKSHSIAEILDV
jgi:SNF2 family DNA or RNA helicase